MPLLEEVGTLYLQILGIKICKIEYSVKYLVVGPSKINENEIFTAGAFVLGLHHNNQHSVESGPGVLLGARPF